MNIFQNRFWRGIFDLIVNLWNDFNPLALIFVFLFLILGMPTLILISIYELISLGGDN